MLPRLGFTGLIALAMSVTAAAAGAAPVTVHGMVSQGYLNSSDYNYLTPDTEQGTFSFNEVLVNFTSQIDDKTRIGLQLLGRDLGPQGNGEVIVDWGFGDYRWKDELGFRAGKLKTPLGFYNKTRDVDAVRTAVLLPQSVYSESFRSVSTAVQGAAVYGNLPLGGTGGVDYELCVGAVEMGSSQFLGPDMAALAPGAPMLDYTIENKIAYGGQVIWNTPFEGLRIGGTFSALEADGAGTFALGLPVPWTIGMNIKANSITVVSADYVRDALSLAAEYIRMDVDVTLTNLPFPDGSGGFLPVAAQMEDNRGGYYAQGAYRLGRVVEVGAYYSVHHPDWNDRDGADVSPAYAAWQKDAAFTARFDVTAAWTFKLEGHLINGTGDLDPAYNSGGFATESWTMFAAKSTFNF